MNSYTSSDMTTSRGYLRTMCAMPSSSAAEKTLPVGLCGVLSTSSLVRSLSAALDGKKYASYGARFEGRIVRKMIEHDGGRGFEQRRHQGRRGQGRRQRRAARRG